MQLAIDCAGFTPAEADRLRQAMSAKRAPERIEELRQRLLDGMAERGIGPAVAQDIYEKILAFSSYGFPESHAISFAYLVYASAWLKRYYPAAFTTALLRNQPMGFYAPHSLINDARRHGVIVLGVDVNASDALATLERTGPEDPAIRPGLASRAEPGPGQGRTRSRRAALPGPGGLRGQDRAARPRPRGAGHGGRVRLLRAQQARRAVGGRAAASVREGQLPGTATGLTAPPLPAMTPAEETLADLWATGTYGTHPVAHVRAGLDRAAGAHRGRARCAAAGSAGGRGRPGHPPAAAAHRARRGIPQPGGRDRHGERHLPAPGVGTSPADGLRAVLPAMTPAEETLADLWATSTYGTHPVAHIRAALDARQVLPAAALCCARRGSAVAVAAWSPTGSGRPPRAAWCSSAWRTRPAW